MEYEEKYKNALERAREYKKHGCMMINVALDNIFPELKESKDERIRNALIAFHKATIEIDGIKGYDIIEWLEKQGEQNYKIIKGKNYFCVKTHNYAGVEWIKGTKYYASDNYTLVNQGCEYYCPEYSKEEHNNLFEEVKYDGCVENKMNANKVEPKFHEGDFIIANDSSHIYQVMDVKRGIYVIKDLTDDVEYHIGIEEAHKSGRLWTIQYAKDGDVYVAKGSYLKDYLFMFSSFTEDNVISTHFGYDVFHGTFDTKLTRFGREEDFFSVTPATKEQRTLLFQKMHEAGYEWDADKKELKKTETKGGEE